MQQHKGQSTVEYVLLVTAVITIIIISTAGNKGFFSAALNSVYNNAASDMLNVSARMTSSLASVN
ncbi:MAG: class III signal peptide-containing protein [Candidatus Omnitrophica bacterium]|nr:class III signal peptide-containing protein [Candidatus Omnitrophota bacterium]